MIQTIIKKEKDGLKIRIKIERGVNDETAYADGLNIDPGKNTYEFITIEIEKDGKGVYCRDLSYFYKIEKDEKLPGAYARLGDAYITEPIYNTIKDTLNRTIEIADVVNANDYRKLKTQEEAAEIQAEKNATEIEEPEALRRQNPDWRGKCLSYCLVR